MGEEGVKSPAMRWFWSVVKILLSAVLIVICFLLIEFHDEHDLVLKSGEKIVADDLREEGDCFIVTIPDRGERKIEQSAVASRKSTEGFFTIVRRADKGIFLICLGLMLIPQTLLAFRWWLLLRSQQIPMRFSQTFFVCYAGAFFNNFLPGGTGGDIARAVMAAKETERKIAVVGTIILDRLIGLASVLIMASVVLTFNLKKSGFGQASVLVYGMMALFLSGYLLYFNKELRGTRFVEFVKNIMPFKEAVKEADETLKSVNRMKFLIFQTLLLSAICQLSTISVNYGLAQALKIDNVGYAQMVVFISVIFVFNALPISVGGLGVGEMSYVFLFASAGVPANQALALSILYRVSLILVSLPGGAIAMMGYWKRRGSRIVENARA